MNDRFGEQVFCIQFFREGRAGAAEEPFRFRVEKNDIPVCIGCHDGIVGTADEPGLKIGFAADFLLQNGIFNGNTQAVADKLQYLTVFSCELFDLSATCTNNTKCLFFLVHEWNIGQGLEADFF